MMSCHSPTTSASIALWNMLAGFLTEGRAPIQSKAYPPTNILKREHTVEIQLALAGFAKEDISVSVKDRLLEIQATLPESTEEITFLLKGISSKNVREKFVLAEHAEVKSAKFDNGILSIIVERNVPPEEEPTKIQIM